MGRKGGEDTLARWESGAKLGDMKNERLLYVKSGCPW
jgi:hypothetical protein